MKTRIAIYGGTNLSAELVRFVRRVTGELLGLNDVVILSGGFECFKNHSDRTSVDLAVLEEAEKRLPPKQFAERFETLIPAPALDRRTVKRFRKGTPHELSGTAQASRFSVVSAADALVTIAGEGTQRPGVGACSGETSTPSCLHWRRFAADVEPQSRRVQ